MCVCLCASERGRWREELSGLDIWAGLSQLLFVWPIRPDHISSCQPCFPASLVASMNPTQGCPRNCHATHIPNACPFSHRRTHASNLKGSLLLMKSERDVFHLKLEITYNLFSHSHLCFL